MNRRPQIVHFNCILTDETLSIRASLSFSRKSTFQVFDPKNITELLPTKPIENLGLLKSNEFRVKVIAYSTEDKIILEKEFDSDSFGNFNIRLHIKSDSPKPTRLSIYETLTHPGIEHLLGSFIPLQIKTPKKILITDFDKTLVDTRYSSPRELYISLKSAINYFPKVPASIELVKNYIKEGYEPFVVSASPHFYEVAIRDWLYQNELYTGNIFLKDYRSIFSFFAGNLTTKDLKNQAFYKLNQLVTILLMTGIPDELALIGDGFESDTIIYLALMSVIVDRHDPWMVWNKLKRDEAFQLTQQQNIHFLSKFYQLKNLLEQHTCSKFSIDIRCKKGIDEEWKKRKLSYHFLDQLKDQVNFYVG